MANSIPINYQTCGTCQYWQGVRAIKGNEVICESYDGYCPVTKSKRSCRTCICTKFVSV